jgi:hypothetical protein
MNASDKPALFGIRRSNRDFTTPESWGKNQFNSSFPAALACYMGEHAIEPIYLTLNEQLEISHSMITVEKLFGLPHDSDRLFFSFEESFTPYADLVVGSLPRADLVTRDASTKNKDCLAALEVKLTALPDNSTFDATEDRNFGCEIVVRPDTIIYIALAIARMYIERHHELLRFTAPVSSRITNWEDAIEIRSQMLGLIEVIDNIVQENLDWQMPLLLQPIWKTQGKRSILAENCFDMFVWSDFGVTRLFVDNAKNKRGIFTRQERTVVWLVKMLDDFAHTGKINAVQVTNQLSYSTRNDKAFAVSGKVTNPYMMSAELTTPRIKSLAVKDIILGNGQYFLSPERRLDAIILNSPDLFD